MSEYFGIIQFTFLQPLDEDLKDELSGDFEECICSLIREPRELDAVMIHDAISVIYFISVLWKGGE